jgi:hypothetical protein
LDYKETGDLSAIPLKNPKDKIKFQEATDSLKTIRDLFRPVCPFIPPVAHLSVVRQSL